MQPNAAAPVWAQLLPYLAVAALLIVRFARPQRISVTRMWIMPIVLCALAAWAIYITEKLNPAPVWEIAVGLLAGVAIGTPFGVLRGMHTDVRPADRPGVMYLGTSWITMVIFIGAFGLRFAVRQLMPHTGALSGAIGDALLAFAIVFLITSYAVIFRKYEAAVSS